MAAAINQAEAPESRPFDKFLGRKADPEGGRIYDKRSALAVAESI